MVPQSSKIARASASVGPSSSQRLAASQCIRSCVYVTGRTAEVDALPACARRQTVRHNTAQHRRVASRTASRYFVTILLAWQARPPMVQVQQCCGAQYLRRSPDRVPLFVQTHKSVDWNAGRAWWGRVCRARQPSRTHGRCLRRMPISGAHRYMRISQCSAGHTTKGQCVGGGKSMVGTWGCMNDASLEGD